MRSLVGRSIINNPLIYKNLVGPAGFEPATCDELGTNIVSLDVVPAFGEARMFALFQVLEGV